MPVSPHDESAEQGDDALGHRSEEEAGGSSTEQVPSRKDEIEAGQEEVEEVQRQKLLRAPDTPTREELAEHHANGHLPYRSWCPECVEAFGREWAHKHSEGRSVPLVSCDYLFIIPRGRIVRKDELEEGEREGALTVLVLYCSASKSVFAHAVPKKGFDSKGYIVEQIKEDILWLGHSRVVIKGDNEPALVQVIQAAVAALKMAGVQSATDEGSVPYDPQTNGAAESAVKLLKGTLRANVMALEKRIQAQIPSNVSIMDWLVRYYALVRTIRVIGTDGKTAQQRVRGSSAITRLIPFGEVCRYKTRMHEGGNWRWSTGVWLGIERRTGQYLVYDKDHGGIRTARTILRMPDPQQWSLDKIKEVAATPWTTHEAPTPEVIHHKQSDIPPTLDKAPQLRRVYIKQADLNRFGYTQGCKRCQHILMYGPSSGTMPHSDACRARIVAELSNTEDGRARLERLTERTDRYIAEHMKQQIEGSAAASQGRNEQNGPQQHSPLLEFLPLPTPAGQDLGPVPVTQDLGPVPAAAADPATSSSNDSGYLDLGHAGSHESGPASFSEAHMDQSHQEGDGMDVGITEVRSHADEGEEEDLRKLMAVYTREMREEARRNHEDMIALITSLGHQGAKYRREATKRIRAIMAEVYSAPRVTALARRRSRIGIIPGLALDLTVIGESGRPWDFNDPTQRSKAERLLDEQKPLLLIGSPMCTAFSNIQNLNKARRDPETMERDRESTRAPQVVLSPLSEAGG